MPVPSFAFVSIFGWPAGWERERMIDALARCIGIDPADAAMRAAKPPPLAVARMEERPAGAAVRSLREMGIRAFAPTQKQLNGLAAPIHAKRLSAARGSEQAMYAVEPWRGETVGLRMSEVSLIVRAAVISRRTTAGDATTQIRFDSMTGTMHLDRVETPPRRTGMAEIIELHTAGGQRFRIDGNKFSFDVLEESQGQGDGVNADMLAKRLIAETPRAAVGSGFATFAPPPGAVRALDPGAPLARSRMPEFEFYSAWIHILYRLALGA